MDEPLPVPSTKPPDERAAGRLDSWKDIAAYLKRDVSTVQRWEKREAMPVHRHLHDKLGSVYGFRAELDAWYQSRNLRVECGEDRTAPLVHRLESTADGSSARIGEGILDDSTNGAWTEAGSLATASTTSPRASRWPFIWLMIGAGAVIAAATAVVLLERADYFWRNPLADAQFRPVTDFGGTEQAAAISRDGKFIAFL